MSAGLKIFILSACCFFLFYSTSDCLAHKVRIFAYSEGETILGETAFSGGRAPIDSEIIVENAENGETVHTCRTDKKGHFSFPIPPEAKNNHLDLRIIVNVGDGHRAEWLLTAAEYLEEGEEISTTTIPPKNVNVSNNEIEAVNPIIADEARIQEMIEKTMDKKLGPIKRMLADNQNDNPDFRDILGAIGYIIGIAGIIAYFKVNSTRGERK